jgi:hypothetical protein
MAEALVAAAYPPKTRGQSLLDLDDYENVNYLCAIKRIIGMEPVPEPY